ncbi:MAG: hypothetical protein QOI99_1309 [Actinomycetota bacterium]|nr:hypothetical protein [Actinomycetota bacterium]
MPFTYLSHQAPVLAIKRRWPARFDGTAMVMGSMAPDWAYAFRGTPIAFDAHRGWGLALFCVPAAVLAAAILRRQAGVVFAYVPSPPEMPLRQLRVLSSRRPGLAVSAVSALVGALTHVVWDLFTHDGSWGPEHIAGLRSHALTALGRTLSWAGVLQWTGHVVGAAVALYLLSRILRSGELLRWYGIDDDVDADDVADDVDDVEAGGPAVGTVRFWTITALVSAGGAAWAATGHPGLPGRIIRLSLGVAAGVVAASVACAGEVAPGDGPAEDRKRLQRGT